MTIPTNHDENFAEGEEAPPPGTRWMALIRWCLLAAIALVAATSWAAFVTSDATHSETPRYQCPMHPQITSPDPGECPICHMDLEPIDPSRVHHGNDHAPATTPTIYRCPMHPDEHSTSPGSCPICHMDLVADPQTESAGPPGTAPLQLSLGRRQAIGLRTATVQTTRAPLHLRAPAQLELPEAGAAQVHVRAAGFLERVMIDETGVLVRRGQALADLYSPEIYQGQTELLAARRWSSSEGTPAVTAARQRLELLGMSTKAIDRVIANGKPSRTISVTAPASGVIVNRRAVLGAYVSPDTVLYELRATDHLYVIAEVPADHGAAIQPGDPATLTMPAHPELSHRLEVDLIYPELSREARSFRVRLTVRDPTLRAGEYGFVNFDGEDREVLAIPRDAVVSTGTSHYVFVDHGAGHLEPQSVELGLTFAEQVEVREGLRAGQTVVAGATFLVDAESRLRAAFVAAQ